VTVKITGYTFRPLFGSVFGLNFGNITYADITNHASSYRTGNPAPRLWSFRWCLSFTLFLGILDFSA
jgi:hypothetical protein